MPEFRALAPTILERLGIEFEIVSQHGRWLEIHIPEQVIVRED